MTNLSWLAFTSLPSPSIMCSCGLDDTGSPFFDNFNYDGMSLKGEFEEKTFDLKTLCLEIQDKIKRHFCCYRQVKKITFAGKNGLKTQFVTHWCVLKEKYQSLRPYFSRSVVGVKFTYVEGSVEICEANTYVVLQIHIWRYIRANTHLCIWCE